MASLGEVGDGLDRVLNKAAEAGAALQNAAELAEDAQRLLVSAAEGSLQADVETTNAQFVEAVRGIGELHQHLGAGMDGTQKILNSLELRGDASTDTAAPQQSAPPPDPARAPPEGGSDQRVERLRQALPPPVRRGTGQKTHGKWLTPGTKEGNEEPIASGKDRLSALAEARLRDLGARRAPVTTSDVEIKLAVHMAEAGITEATLVINNTVCEGPYGCDTLVPMLLPENSVLTVHEVTDAGVTTKKYRGGAKPTWR